jgi:hypothetical protein
MQETTQTAPLDAPPDYDYLQVKLLDLIGDAERATKGAKAPDDMQACGQMARRLCYALIGF